MSRLFRQQIEEILRRKELAQTIEEFAADLGTIASTTALLDHYTSTYDHLDLLVLNADAVAGEVSVTSVGIETTFAVGCLSRCMFSIRLNPVLACAGLLSAGLTRGPGKESALPDVVP